MKNEALENLRNLGLITSYDYFNVDENGYAGRKSKGRNTESLVLFFKDGSTLEINTFCSGCSENTTMEIK